MHKHRLFIVQQRSVIKKTKRKYLVMCCWDCWRMFKYDRFFLYALLKGDPYIRYPIELPWP